MSIVRDDRQAALPIAPTDQAERSAAIEALLFVSGEGEDVSTLAAALGWPVGDVRAGIDQLEEELHTGSRGIVLQRAGERVQLVTNPRHGAAVARLLGLERTARLSGAALETLAIIAYRQPATRGEVEAVRGVDSSSVIATLLARELIEAAGKRAAPGSPTEYVTTGTFLQLFGISSLAELPPLSD